MVLTMWIVRVNTMYFQRVMRRVMMMNMIAEVLYL